MSPNIAIEIQNVVFQKNILTSKGSHISRYKFDERRIALWAQRYALPRQDFKHRVSPPQSRPILIDQIAGTSCLNPEQETKTASGSELYANIKLIKQVHYLLM